MMKAFFKFLMAVLILVPAMTVAAITFTEGKEYEVLAPTSKMIQKSKTIEVIEFFNYGCTWCYKIEPEVEAWLKSNPDNVTFRRIPVVFNKNWEPLAKAYYVADAFDATDKMNSVIFTAIHVQGKNVSSEKALSELFAGQGIAAEEFKSAYNFSPGIDAKIIRGEDLVRQYEVFQVPAFIVGGKYKTDTSMVGGDKQKMIQVLDYLIKDKM